MVDTPSHPSTDHRSDKPSADPKECPRRPIELPASEGLSLDELRREWRRLYRSEPPRISRDLLIRGIGYRLQEIQHGGLGKSTRRKLKTLAKMFRTTGRVAPDPGLSLKPGARLVREWHGRTHTVTVTEDGFEYAGTNYPSLTKIAKKITGAHWSGPRFFGLVRAAHRARATEATMAESEKASRRSTRKTALRDLHAKIVRGRSGAGLQLARRSARSLRRLHSLPEARRLDGLADFV